ncbi:hypothetical protein JavanS321_0025 [Streptococcus satellite phage Javan321]|nr:hypothetical protein JavanS321_0025 [Streptococcus satellite phage Javan321]
MATIKNRLKALRTEKGITQDKLATIINEKLKENEKPISKMVISNWENNKHTIKPEKAQILADFFGVSVAHLLGIDIEKINEFGSTYKNVEEHINNPVKYDNFGKGLLNHSQSYMFTIEELINADKEKNTNFADILINYISLNDYDKKIAFDLVKKLSERDDEKE